MEQTDDRHIAAILAASLVRNRKFKNPRSAAKLLYDCMDAMEDEVHQRSLAKKKARQERPQPAEAESDYDVHKL